MERFPARPPAPTAGLTIAKSDFLAIRRQKRFARRPYGCLLLVRPDYFATADLAAGLAALGVRVTTVPVVPDADKAAFLHRVRDAILACRPDFVLTLSHTGVDAEGTLVALLGDLRLPLASWLLDSPELLLDGYPGLAADHVVIFSCDARAVPGIRALGYRHVHFLPLAAAPAMLAAGERPLPAGPDVRANVSFLGDDFRAETAKRLRNGHVGRELLGVFKTLAERQLASRERRLTALFSPSEADLRERYAALSPEKRRDFELAVECRATTRYRAAVLAALAPLGLLVAGPTSWQRTLRHLTGWRWHPPIREPERKAALFQGSTINGNATSTHMHGAANQRVFDVPAAGGFLLTDLSPQLATLFEPGKEVTAYRSPEDALEQAQRALRDPPARAAVVRAARARIAHEHTYAHRAAALLRALKEWEKR